MTGSAPPPSTPAATTGATRVPRVEVLLASHNTRELLAGCLRSLARCRPPRDVATLGISVFDNGSVDGSAELVLEHFPDVRLVRCGENLGFARANNELARTSDAEYLLLLNTDTVLVEDVVAPLLRALDQHPCAAVAGPRLVYPGGEVQMSGERFPDLTLEVARVLRGTKLAMTLRPVFDVERELESARRPTLDPDGPPRRTEVLWATCWLIRREDARRFGLFDEAFGMYDEDLDLCRRFHDAGRDVLYVPETTVVHVGGASSTSAHKVALMRQARARYYRKHHGAFHAATFRYVVGGVDSARRVTRRLRVGADAS